MKKIMLFLLISFAFFGVGCVKNNETFPIINDSVKPHETSYKVCEDLVTGARVYESSFFGYDSGMKWFYNKDGNLIEKIEIGEGVMNNLQPKTEVKNCVRTTEEYFKSRVTIE
ncbi:MAG: hypothetical protein V1716_01885 [Candidatus Uhrbacteria bacterium]